MNQQSSNITFGMILRNARMNRGLSQRELAEILQQHSLNIDYKHLAKLENNRIDIKTSDYDKLMETVAKIFQLDVSWLEQIREQTEVEELDLSGAMFPVYWKDFK